MIKEEKQEKQEIKNKKIKKRFLFENNKQICRESRGGTSDEKWSNSTGQVDYFSDGKYNPFCIFSVKEFKKVTRCGFVIVFEQSGGCEVPGGDCYIQYR